MSGWWWVGGLQGDWWRGDERRFRWVKLQAGREGEEWKQWWTSSVIITSPGADAHSSSVLQAAEIHLCACACVIVCVCEREKEEERGRMCVYQHGNDRLLFTISLKICADWVKLRSHASTPLKIRGIHPYLYRNLYFLLLSLSLARSFPSRHLSSFCLPHTILFLSFRFCLSPFLTLRSCRPCLESLPCTHAHTWLARGVERTRARPAVRPAS